MNLAIYTFFLSLLLTTALLPFLVKIAPLIGMVDLPDARKIHKKGVPRIGGIAIVIGILVPLFLWLPMHHELFSILCAILILAIIMVLDDKLDLDFRYKLIVQFAVSSIVVVHGDILITNVPFIPVDLSEWLAAPLTIIFLVGVTNAINLSDGLDGLVGGTTILSSACLGLLAYNTGNDLMVMMALAIIGSTIGFLRFNTHPARVFMGDTGSQCLGFSIGILTIQITQSSQSQISPLVPFLILGLPLLDTVWVIIRRIRQKRSPFSPDRNHLHHRLLDLNMTAHEAVVLIYSVQLVMIVTAYFLANSSNENLLLAIAIYCVIIITGLNIAEKNNYRLHDKANSNSGYVSTIFNYIKTHRLTTAIPYKALSILVPILLIFVSVVGETVDYDISLMAFILMLLFVFTIRYKIIPGDVFIRFLAFITSACVIYIIDQSSGLLNQCQNCIHVTFALLALFVVIWVRYSANEFKFNSFDYLFIVIVSMVPYIPGFKQYDIGVMVIQMMILFYACEIVISKTKSTVSVLHLGVLGSLAIISVKGLLV